LVFIFVIFIEFGTIFVLYSIRSLFLSNFGQLLVNYLKTVSEDLIEHKNKMGDQIE